MTHRYAPLLEYGAQMCWCASGIIWKAWGLTKRKRTAGTRRLEANRRNPSYRHSRVKNSREQKIMVSWLPRAAADVPSGSRHGVSRVRRVRGHPTARAPHAHMSRRPRHARTRQRAHSPTHLHDNAQARHRHISAHCAPLTPPTAAPLGAGGRTGTPAAIAHSTRRPRGPRAWNFTPI